VTLHRDPDASVEPEGRAVRVSTLELFFDLVFVFTITQFTRLLADDPTAASLARVFLLFSVTWYAYDSYAWLTNALALDVLAYRLLLLEGMACFLVMALAIPTTFAGGGVAFGIPFMVAIALHSGLFIRATSAREATAMRAITPWNLLVATVVLAGAVFGGDAQWALMAVAAAIVWSEALFISVGGFHVSASHFVERHGLLVIIALGESVVALGLAAGGARVDLDAALIAILGLSLSACLWWTYFRDEEAIEAAFAAAPAGDRARLALLTYGYLHFFLLFAVVLLAAGLKHAIPSPLEHTSVTSASLLAGGTALFLVADAGMLRLLAIAQSRAGIAMTAAAVATIPIGAWVSAAAEVAALVAVVGSGLIADAYGRQPPESGSPMRTPKRSISSGTVSGRISRP
jgi:low temperature requirement protein LtrA